MLFPVFSLIASKEGSTFSLHLIRHIQIIVIGKCIIILFQLLIILPRSTQMLRVQKRCRIGRIFCDQCRIRLIGIRSFSPDFSVQDPAVPDLLCIQKILYCITGRISQFVWCITVVGISRHIFNSNCIFIRCCHLSIQGCSGFSEDLLSVKIILMQPVEQISALPEFCAVLSFPAVIRVDTSGKSAKVVGLRLTHRDFQHFFLFRFKRRKILKLSIRKDLTASFISVIFHFLYERFFPL